MGFWSALLSWGAATLFKSESEDTKKLGGIKKEATAMESGEVEFTVDGNLLDDFKDLIRRLQVSKSSERLGVVGKASGHRLLLAVGLR